VRFLRRNSADDSTTATEVVDAENSELPKGHSAGKGRPTPKRREAEGRRRGPVPPPPRTQREAMRRNRTTRPTREQRVRENTQRRERMMAGDEKYLLPKDRGPVKAFARDAIDARRNLMGLFMPLAVVVLVSYVAQIAVPTVPIQLYVMAACLLFLLAMVVEAVMLGRLVAKLARAELPKESVGIVSMIWYTFTRASQVRRLRIPRPRVRPGETVKAR
jgi:Protein of unknown function (DUF3043)